MPRHRVAPPRREEQAGAGALVDFHVEDVLAVEKHLALGDLILWVAGDGVGQGGLAGTVRPQQGDDAVMRFAGDLYVFRDHLVSDFI